MKNLEAARLFFLAFLTLFVVSAAGLLGIVPFYLAWGFVALVLVTIMLLRGASASVNPDAVWNALSLSVWKSTLRIVRELRKNGSIDRSTRQIIGVVIHLSNFLAEGLIERRINPVTKRYRMNRGKTPISEYRRTSFGPPRRRKRVFDRFRDLIPVRST